MDTSPKSRLLIPRLFHRVWLGGVMPAEFVRFGETWLEHNPGWEMRVWTEDDLPPLRNRDLYDSVESYAQKSDVIRFELLWRYGGVYVDCDFECRRSIEQLLYGLDAFAAFEDDAQVSNAIIGAVAGHRFIDYLVRSLPASVKEHGAADPVVSTGPGYLTRCLAEFDPGGTAPITLFPASHFYPYSWTQMYRRYERFDQAYAVHHWAGSWGKASEPRLKALVRSVLMRSALTRQAFYARSWLRRRFTHLGGLPDSQA
jgi:mannosyltransferase OCH1-like enzyme